MGLGEVCHGPKVLGVGGGHLGVLGLGQGLSAAENEAALGEEEVREEEVHPPQQEMPAMHAGDLDLRSKVIIPSVLLSHQQPPFPTVNISGH